jgi:hypothetical protein
MYFKGVRPQKMKVLSHYKPILITDIKRRDVYEQPEDGLSNAL